MARGAQATAIGRVIGIETEPDQFAPVAWVVVSHGGTACTAQHADGISCEYLVSEACPMLGVIASLGCSTPTFVCRTLVLQASTLALGYQLRAAWACADTERHGGYLEEMGAHKRIAAWFLIGVAGWIFGGLIVLAGIWIEMSEDWIAAGTVIAMLGWAAMLVGVIGKGVELGVRAANDE